MEFSTARFARALDSVWLYRGICLALIGFVAARAALGSIVHDEAATYALFVSKDVEEIVTYSGPGAYANNHMGLSLLAKLSLALFGLHEFTLRLPTVVAYAIYVASIGAILRLFLTGIPFWVFFLAATINPFIIDLMSVARGYGLGCAFMTAGIFFLMKAQGEDQRLAFSFSAAAAVSLALAAICQFTFLLLFAAGVGWRLLVLGYEAWRTKERRMLAAFEAGFAIAVTGVLYLLVSGPIERLRNTDGLNMGIEGTQSFIYETLRGTVYGIFDTVGFFSLLNTAVSFLALAITGVSTVCAAAWLPKADAKDQRFMAFLLCAVLVCGVSAASVIQHHLLKVPYLIPRTAAFYIPLVTLLGATLVANLRAASFADLRRIGLTVTVIFAALLPAYAAEVDMWRTHVWAYDASGRFVMRDLAAMHNPADPQPKRLATEWFFVPSLNFYIEKDRMTWLIPIERDLPWKGFDFYYLSAPAVAAVEQEAGPLKVLKTYALTGTVLAVPDPDAITSAASAPFR